MDDALRVDGRPELRDVIADHARLAQQYSGLIQEFAELADDAGLEYTVRKFAAFARVVASTANDLIASNKAWDGLPGERGD